jgi:hypothetical protein
VLTCYHSSGCFEGVEVPFRSKSQQRFFFAKANEKGSGITKKKALEWAHETKSIKKLPEHVKKSFFMGFGSELEKIADTNRECFAAAAKAPGSAVTCDTPKPVREVNASPFKQMRSGKPIDVTAPSGPLAKQGGAGMLLGALFLPGVAKDLNTPKKPSVLNRLMDKIDPTVSPGQEEPGIGVVPAAPTLRKIES